MTDDALADLRAELAALRAEVAALRAAPAVGTAPPPATDDRPEGRRVSRRGLLAAAVAGGAGLVATQVTTAAPAAANSGDPVVMGANNDAADHVTIITSGAGRQSATLGIVNPDPSGNGIGLYAQLGAQSGLVDDGGVAAVVGDSRDGIGVSGFSIAGPAIFGRTTGQFNPAVYGVSTASSAVVGESFGGSAGVYGSSSGPGVRGQSFGAEGLRGESVNGPGATAQSDAGAGLVASGGGTLPGVDATSTKGYGVLATGGRAPLRLTPGTTTGAPKKDLHKAGELYVDKTGVLYYCTANGTPGTWKKVTLT